ncbi:hypothetical protein M422DRAFT_243405 [Sphaerobolus stellatus SS14]|nr:hypothetical protein M422DRAFT_243405 [Sphaerobolus stellatus SS14]
MPTASNPRILMNKYCNDGYPIPGETIIYDTTQEIDLDKAPLNGQVLIKVCYLNIHPYQRKKMRDGPPGNIGYPGSYILGKPLTNFGVGVIIRSQNPQFKVGDHVCGALDFQAYMIHSNNPPLNVLPKVDNLPLSAYLGNYVKGQTAYFGWKEYSKAKKGETLFVSSAAGPVGSIIIQIAISQGLKVVASAGSDEKVEYVKELGVDVAFNYKTQDTRAVLETLGSGIDIYWDNIGGKTLEAALDFMNNHGRIIACGYISEQNTNEHYGIKNFHSFFPRRLSMHGFLVSDYWDHRLAEFYTEFPPKVVKGEIQYTEVKYEGLEKTGQAFLDNLKGGNKGTTLIVVANE